MAGHRYDCSGCGADMPYDDHEPNCPTLVKTPPRPRRRKRATTPTPPLTRAMRKAPPVITPTTLLARLNDTARDIEVLSYCPDKLAAITDHLLSLTAVAKYLLARERT